MYTVSVVSIATMALVEAVVISLFVDYLYVVSMLRKELRIITLHIIIKLSTGILQPNTQATYLCFWYGSDSTR
jgi:hypothetical protein